MGTPEDTAPADGDGADDGGYNVGDMTGHPHHRGSAQDLPVPAGSEAKGLPVVGLWKARTQGSHNTEERGASEVVVDGGGGATLTT